MHKRLQLLMCIFCTLMSLTLILASCIPSFRPAEPDELWLTQDGTTRTLHALGPIEEAAVTVRAERVTSPLCRPVGCSPDADGLVTLYAPVSLTRGSSVELGQLEGFVRLRVVVVLRGSDEAIERVLKAGEDD